MNPKYSKIFGIYLLLLFSANISIIILTSQSVFTEFSTYFSSFSNFNKSRDAACCVKITHPSSISLSFRLYLYQHVMVRLPSAFPVTQTTPLSKESRESLVYIHVCVFRDFGKSRALVSRWAVKPACPECY